MMTEEKTVTYEAVSQIVGSVMDQAFKEILRKMANGEQVKGISEKISNKNDFATFFECLDNAHMEISFRPSNGKTAKTICWDSERIPVNGFKEKWSGEVG